MLLGCQKVLSSLQYVYYTILCLKISHINTIIIVCFLSLYREDLDICSQLDHCKLSTNIYTSCIWKDQEELTNISDVSRFFPTTPLPHPPTPPGLFYIVNIILLSYTNMCRASFKVSFKVLISVELSRTN